MGVNKRPLYDPNTMGYGKHKFVLIDPAKVDAAEYEKAPWDGKPCSGLVREVNTALNCPHPQTTLTVYDVGVLGTQFETQAEGWAGQWEVVDLPKVRAPRIWVQARWVGPTGELEGGLELIDTVDLGIVVDELNCFKQVISSRSKLGKISREQKRFYGERSVGS